jgi:hypothetical protein
MSRAPRKLWSALAMLVLEQLLAAARGGPVRIRYDLSSNR